MPRVIHFEVSADDCDRAQAFYKDVFQWSFESFGGPNDYRLAVTGPESQPGINGAIFKRETPINFMNTIDVPSLEEYVSRVLAAGGKLVSDKMVIPGVGYLVYCVDTEGNVFGMMQMEKDAKPF